MEPQPRNSNDQPPTPGGDPDQPPSDLPVPPTGQEEGQPKGKDKKGYGHTGNNDVPPPEGAPPPHQIF
jgi:hypothetical protein